MLYVTFPSKKTAQALTTALLKQRLIACVNSFPISSTYWWKGKITKSKEVVTLLKTTSKNKEKVKSYLIKHHPYDTPCILELPIKATKAYESWIQKETR